MTLRRVAKNGVSDIIGHSYAISNDNVAKFTDQDFALIVGLQYGKELNIRVSNTNSLNMKNKYSLVKGM